MEEERNVTGEEVGTVEGAGTESTNGTESTTSEPAKKQQKTFTQAQVTRMMTREKNQGRDAAFREMGIDPKDTRMVSMFKAFVESQKSEGERATEDVAAAKAAQAEAEQKVFIAEARAEAMLLGVKAQFVDDAVALAAHKMSDDEGVDLKTALNELKDKYSMWFEEDENDDGKGNGVGKTVGQKGTGSAIKETGGNGKNATAGMGVRLAASRKAASAKSHYWGKN